MIGEWTCRSLIGTTAALNYFLGSPKPKAPLPDRYLLVHLPRLPRDGAAAAHVHQDGHSHRRDLRVREHAEKATRGLFARVHRRHLRERADLSRRAGSHA